MKLYISGPMRGYPRTNFPMFDEVSRYVRSCADDDGTPWVALSPADNDRRVWPGIESTPGFVTGAHVDEYAPPGFTFPELFVWDVQAIGESDGIVLLPGWEQSTGAGLELACAEAFGKTVLFAVIEDGKCVYIQPSDPNYVTTAQIIGLMGYAQVGKDTAAATLVADGYERIAFADALRDMLYALNPSVPFGDLDRMGSIIPEGWTTVSWLVDHNGWDAAKQNPEVRRLLQRLGTEAGRQVLGQDIWVRTAMQKAKPGGKYIITDVRFPNEADAIRAAGGQLVRIMRPGYGPVNNHPSETALDDVEADYTIVNNDTLAWLAGSIRRAILPF